MRKKIPANGNLPLTDLEKNKLETDISEKFAEIISLMGIDSQDPNVLDTPKRVAKMYVQDIFSGLFTEAPKITVFPNTQEYDQIITLTDISVKSTCSHHLAAFIGTAHIGYIPDKNVVGLSKLSRIVDYFARRPQIQEELTQQIANFIEETLHPKGVIVVIKCEHQCMKLRGVEEHESVMATSAVRGYFLHNPSTKQEFFELIKK